MCLIILRPADVAVPKYEWLSNAFKQNSDGAGFAWANNGILFIKKGFFQLEPFVKSLRKAENRNPNSPFLIHFRWATHGSKNFVNCHPFKVWGTHVMAHNGIIPGMGNTNQSDTAKLAEVLTSLSNSSILNNEAGLKALQFLAGGSSKLVFLDADRKHTIVNEKAGEWDEGCWFSNSCYKFGKWRSYVFDNDEDYRWHYNSATNDWYKGSKVESACGFTGKVSTASENKTENKYNGNPIVSSPGYQPSFLPERFRQQRELENDQLDKELEALAQEEEEYQKKLQELKLRQNYEKPKLLEGAP